MRFLFVLFLSFKAFAGSPKDWPSTFKGRLGSETNYYFQIGGAEPRLFTRGQISTPASLAKLFTAELALSELPSSYQFSSRLEWTEKSGLRVFAVGSPEFELAELDGLSGVSGDIEIVSEGVYEKPKDMTEISDSGYCYNALPNPINHSKNCVSLTITADSVKSSDPDLDVIFKTEISFGSKYNSTRPHFKWLNVEKTKFEYVIQVRLKDRDQKVKVDVVVPDTSRWMKNKIRRYLTEHQNVGAVVHPRHLILNSDPVEYFLCQSLSESINLYASAIFREVSEQTVSKFLGSFPGVVLVDGTGMSRANKIPGDSLFKILEDIHQSQRFLFYKRCLPAPLSTGTLEDRLPALSGRLVAKTGSLSGLSHIAGYFKSKVQKSWIPFVFMLENRQLSVRSLREIQDQILTELLLSMDREDP